MPIPSIFVSTLSSWIRRTECQRLARFEIKGRECRPIGASTPRQSNRDKGENRPMKIWLWRFRSQAFGALRVSQSIIGRSATIALTPKSSEENPRKFA